MIKILSLLTPTIDSIFGKNFSKKYEAPIKLALLVFFYFFIVKPFLSFFKPIFKGFLENSMKVGTAITSGKDSTDFVKLDAITDKLIKELHADLSGWDLFLLYPISSGFGFGDSGDVNEEAVIDLLNQMNDKADVVYVCKMFSSKTEKSLMKMAKACLSTSELTRVKVVVKENWY